MTRHESRPAYTLLEIIVVMALLVIVTAMAVPMVKSMIIDTRIRTSADTVRARVADARARALEEGRPWRLGFLPNTGVFQLAPNDSSDWDNVNQDPTDTDKLTRDTLPQDIIFGLSENDISGAKEAGSAGSKWETLGVYLGDGGARDDTTTYFGHPGITPMRIRLRGLTGAVSIETPIMVKDNPQ